MDSHTCLTELEDLKLFENEDEDEFKAQLNCSYDPLIIRLPSGLITSFRKEQILINHRNVHEAYERGQESNEALLREAAEALKTLGKATGVTSFEGWRDGRAVLKKIKERLGDG